MTLFIQSILLKIQIYYNLNQFCNFRTSILYKKILIYSPKKNSHIKNGKLIDFREHVKSILNFPNISISDDEKKLKLYLNKNLKNKKINFKKNQIDEFRNKHLFSNNENFGQRLSNNVTKIIN